MFDCYAFFEGVDCIEDFQMSPGGCLHFRPNDKEVRGPDDKLQIIVLINKSKSFK